jgi:ABC-type glycerol-3-phosphate transport system substrate-binding protein
MLFDAGIGAEHEAAFKGLPAWTKVKAALPPTFLEGANWRGKQVALPLYVVNQAMVYAPAHLEKAGIRPPAAAWTWNDFLEIAKRASKPPDVWALDKAWSASQWQIWAGSNGALMFNKEKTKVTLTQPESVAAMEFLSTLTHGLGLVPPEDIGELLVKGQSVFEPNGPYRMPIWRDAGVRFEPILPPRGPQKPTAHNWGSMYSLIVLKSTDEAKQRAASIAALGALADDAQVPMCQIHLGWPASKSALASSAYQALLAADRQMKTFADMFSSCWILPAIPSFAAIDTLRGTMMTKIYKRQDSIKNALQEAETQGQRLLDEDLARVTRK